MDVDSGKGRGRLRASKLAWGAFDGGGDTVFGFLVASGVAQLPFRGLANAAGSRTKGERPTVGAQRLMRQKSENGEVIVKSRRINELSVEKVNQNLWGVREQGS